MICKLYLKKVVNIELEKSPNKSCIFLEVTKQERGEHSGPRAEGMGKSLVTRVDTDVAHVV